MKQKLSYTLGIIVLVMMSLATNPAQAAKADQTGPYYATPSWDQTLPAGTRFIVLPNMGNAAVLDKETGLVWEQSPSIDYLDWFSAQSHCNNLTVVNRLGWRLPTIQELASLVDITVSNPSLPIGHPFTNVQPPSYWSATASLASPSDAWALYFNQGDVLTYAKTSTYHVWCVRAGHGPDAQ